jgi:hypothetical protein
VKNAHGGTTAMYYFVIEGMEAVSDYWFAHLTRAVRESGGSIIKLEVEDIENQALLHPTYVEKLIAELTKRGV